MREQLVTETIQTLEENGFSVARQLVPSCFDILARKGNSILLLKVLVNVDSLYQDQAEDLVRISDVLEASPLIIGITGLGDHLRDHTIYERYGIPAISAETFQETITEGKLPFVYAKRGGFYAHINADFLKKLREKKKLSLADVARSAGLSRTTVEKYEKGEGAELENILRIQDAIGELIIDPINVFDFEVKKLEEPKTADRFEQSITGQLSDIGFKTTCVTKASFSMIGKHGKDILLTGLKQQQIQKKAQDIHDTANALEQHGMFVFHKKKDPSIAGVPILEKSELEDVITSRELIKILKELEE
jgi:putative transcriptional regulator|tara:strand:+ start:1257 stop:2171 length:915 start_codon:yes stop_codon:yes gene_type:complete